MLCFKKKKKTKKNKKKPRNTLYVNIDDIVISKLIERKTLNIGFDI